MPFNVSMDQGVEYSVAGYAKARAALQQQEREISFDFAFKRDQSSLETKASAVFDRIRIAEYDRLKSTFGFERGQKFYSILPSLEDSDLLRIARRSPKGALLHCHFDAMLPPEVMLPMAQQMTNMHIKCTEPLVSPDSFSKGLPEMQLLSQTKALAMSHVNIFDEFYSSEDFMLYSDFRRSFPTGEKGADEWLLSKIELQKDDAYSPERTVNSVWQCMNSSMRINRGLLRYESAWRDYTRRVIWNLVEDGISYAEIRFAMHYSSTVTSDDGERSPSHKEMIAIVEEVLNQEKKKIEERSLVFHGFKIIYANLRGCSPWEMRWCIQDAICLKQEFPDLICGFDLCGQEDAGMPLSFWVPDLLDMQKQWRDLGLHLPLILHAGETLDDGGDTDSNLYDAILLQSKRIGHGYSLHKHPLLIEICKQRDIAIEICPTSNELLGLCEQMQAHPVYSLLAQSVPCTINTDDPGFWRSSHSHELYQITMGSNKISLAGWKRLAEWSLDHSCMDEEAKTQRKSDFQEDWRLFCAWIIETFP